VLGSAHGDRRTAHRRRRADGIQAIRDEVRPIDVPDLMALRIGILDSGLDTECLRLRRPWTFLGYDAQGAFVENTAPEDPVLHGTRVAKILDNVLPEQIRFSIGRLPSSGAMNDIRVSSFARAYADFIAREAPSVCNVSIGPVPDSVECPQCHRPIETTWLASTILPSLFRLAETATFTLKKGDSPSLRRKFPCRFEPSKGTVPLFQQAAN
jgi:hypothetical protein